MQATQLLQELIRIPSVNPDNDPGTDQTHEQAIADFLAGLFAHHGFEVTLEEVLPNRPNLIARHPAAKQNQRILFGPHLDTVGIGGMTIDPFSGNASNAKIHGRGASDTKGPMAAMIAALINNKDLLPTLPFAIDFVGFCGEESSQQGSKHFGAHHANEYAFAFVGEPTNMQIVNTTKGSAWIELTATGKAAHSSQPELGQNAVMILARALDLINRKLTNHLATYLHPALGHATLNIGTFAGGSRPNIVPDHASAIIDIRTTPQLIDANGSAFELVNTFIEETQLPLTASLVGENFPMETSESHPFIQRWLGHIATSSCTIAPWFSDAAHLAAAGIPSVCIGPGSIDQAHTKDEWISIDALNQGEALFSEFIQKSTLH